MTTRTTVAAALVGGLAGAALVAQTVVPIDAITSRVLEQGSPSVTSAQPQTGTDAGSDSGNDVSGAGGVADGQGTTQSGSNQSQASTATKASDEQAKGVVLIDTALASGGEAAGTGMVLSADGLVLTNYHVVAGSSLIRVTDAATDKTYSASVVGHDATQDVALLQLKDASGLTPVTLDTNGVSVGEAVTAIGNAEGQGYLTVVSGSVQELNTTVTVANEQTGAPSTVDDVFATNVAAVPGDSGGPMVDAQGEVVGMTTAGSAANASSRGHATRTISYAITITEAEKIVAQIEAGRESGSVEIGPKAYLGVSVGSAGLQVSSVQSGSAAASAGITAGDSIVAVDGHRVASHAQLSTVLATLEPGARVTVEWTTAGGTTRRKTVTLGSSPVN